MALCGTGPSDVNKYSMEKNFLTDFSHVLSYHFFLSLSVGISEDAFSFLWK